MFRSSTWYNQQPPNGLFHLNRNCPQAQDLIFWIPTATTQAEDVVEVMTNRRVNLSATTNLIRKPDFGYVIDFNNAHQSVGAADSWVTSSLSGLTMCCWVDMIYGGGTDYVFGLPHTDNLYTFGFSAVDRDGSNRKIQLVVRNGSDTFAIKRHDGDSYQGQIIHVAITASAGAGALYVNGQQVIVQTNYSKTNTLSPDNSGVKLGALPSGSGGFPDSAWDFRMYKGALSQPAIARMYDIATRWELYEPIHAPLWVKAPAVAGGSVPAIMRSYRQRRV